MPHNCCRSHNSRDVVVFACACMTMVMAVLHVVTGIVGTICVALNCHLICPPCCHVKNLPLTHTRKIKKV